MASVGDTDDLPLPVAKTLVQRLLKQKFGTAWFGSPVDPVALRIPSYTTIITNPMDLGTILTKADDEEYKSSNELAADVRLTFSNAMKFNPPGHSVHEVAKGLLAKFDSWYERAKVNHHRALAREAARAAAAAEAGAAGAMKRKASEPGLANHSNKRVKDNDHASVPHATSSSADHAAGAEVYEPFDVESCKKVLSTVINHDCAGPFLKPVDPLNDDVPHYRKIVKKPMDLGTVKKKLTKGQYKSIGAFKSDVRLIWSNCYLFNGNSGVSRMAKQLDQKFDRMCAKYNL